MEENKNTSWNQEDQAQLTLLDIWHMVWDHIGWYILSAIICLAVAAVYIYRSPNIYSRTAKVIIDEGAQEAAMRDLSSFTGMSRYRYSTNVDNEVEAFASPDLMQTVVERLGLEASYVEHQLFRDVELGPDSPLELSLGGDNPKSAFAFDVNKISDSSFRLSNFKVAGEEIEETLFVNGRLSDTLTTPVGRVVLTKALSNSEWAKPITVSWVNSKKVAKRYTSAMDVAISGKQTSVVVLNIKDKFPTRAENILSCLIDVYNESWVSNRNRSAQSTSNFINDRLVVIEQELATIEDAIREYKEDNNVTDIKAVGAAYFDESSEYEAKAFEVNNQLAIANFIKDYLNDPANSLSLIPSNSGLTGGGVENQIKEYNTLLLQRDNLLANSSENNPLVVDLTSSLVAMKSAILRSVENLISTLQLEYAQIQNQVDLVLKRIAASTGQEFDLLSIERQQKVKAQLYVYLLQKREENEIASLVNVGNTRLIMAPNGGSNPVEPRRLVIAFVALLIGCAIPFGIIYLKRILNTSVSTKSDVTNAITSPFLAEIPEVAKKKRLRRRKKVSLDDRNRRILVKAGKRNSINEAFRVLRTNVDMMLTTVSDHKVVMTTSMYPGSGKTFVSLNLAASMAVKGAKVIIVDLDLRKASLSLALSNKPEGASAYLSGTNPNIDECIFTINDNLDVMMAGTIPPNPAELLLSERFTTMINELKERYDYVFLDCPPAEIVADSAIISNSVDMTLFIIRAGLMDRRNLPVVEELANSGKYNRVAVILNGVMESSNKYGKYGKYGYGKGYGYGYGSVYGAGDSDED